MPQKEVLPLEPRVAKLETGLEILTKDVRDLVSVVREQSHNLDGELQKLAIAVTNAAAPRKTDWPMMISLAFLIIALGSAVFYPLNSQITEIKNNDAQTTMTLRNEDAIMYNRLEARLHDLEIIHHELNKADLAELREWRLEAMKRNTAKPNKGSANKER